MARESRNKASFRDPSGFVYMGENGKLLRQVNDSYAPDYRQFIDSGLYDELVAVGNLISHEEISLSEAQTEDAYCVLQPRPLSMISYAYEWSFSALKDAALLTLAVQRQAIQSGMTLKDASHFNVQFEGFRPIFIDTLSFEKYIEGQPWFAYGQFCRHFLAPLALMAKTDIALSRLLTLYLDGIPLDLAAKLLPLRTKFSPGMLMHLHLHAKLVRRFSKTSTSTPSAKTHRRISKQGLIALLDSLRNLIQSLNWKPAGTEWADYYDEHSYCEQGFGDKHKVIETYLSQIRPSTVCDFGANVGFFTRLATNAGARAYAFDIDPACVERCYLDARKRHDGSVLPLWMDLANPTPAIGWANHERPSVLKRTTTDLSMALALVHHLAISNNVPLTSIAALLSTISKHLIIEFVPKSDPQVQRLLQSRTDIFHDYHREGFEAAFRQYFELREAVSVGSDGRVLYLMAVIR
jgi:ribosomal protein L11 methylase PrmA